MTTTSLHLTGLRTKQGYEVQLLDRTIYLPHRLFELSLELSWARCSTQHGILENELSVVIDSDHIKGCDLIRRLRRVMEEHDAIENCRKGYRLSDRLGRPVVSPTVLDLIDVDYRIVRRIEELLLHSHANATVTPFPASRT